MSLSMTQFWLIAIALLLLVEFATSALTTIWFAGGALIALLCAVAGGPVWLQVLLFIAGSAVLLVLTRPIAVKMLRKGTVATNADSLIGQEAVVTEKIDNLRSTGTRSGLPEASIRNTSLKRMKLSWCVPSKA